jgi:trigger factor
MSVVADIKDIGPCRKEVSIRVPEAAVEAELSRVVQAFRSQARAPGFRKGKMPVTMVRQRYREDIEKEVLDRLIPRYWNQARAEKDIDPLLAPEVREVDFEPDSKLAFVATVEVRPPIELGNLADFDLPDPDVEVSETEIAEALERLRRDAGEWVEVDRAAGDGDLVEASVVEAGHVHDDQEDDHSHEVAFEIGDERVWTELSEAARGLAAGAHQSFERPGTEGSAARRFEIDVSAVKERRLAELDDALAAKVGDFSTLGELRAKLGESIAGARRSERRQQRERALLDQLRERHHFPLPERVVEAEIEDLLREYAGELSARGVDVAKAELDWQRMAEQVRPQAVQRVEARLLLDAVAAKLGVTVPSEEIEATLAAIARSEKTSTVAVRQSMDRSGRLEVLRMQLRRRRALQRLLGEPPPDAPSDPIDSMKPFRSGDPSGTNDPDDAHASSDPEEE